MKHCYEIMGLTWLANSPEQTDAILIANTVLQANAKITNLYQFNELDSWCIAVAGRASFFHFDQSASVTVLESVNSQREKCSGIDIDFNKVQENLNQSPTNHIGNSSTLALITSTPYAGHVRIQHLGNSRVYAYSSTDNTWCCLTTDHTRLEELRKIREIKENEIYPKCFDDLTASFHGGSSGEADAHYGQAQEHSMSVYDALLVCSAGVHKVLRSKYWLPFDKEVTHHQWLTTMKKKLSEHNAYENVSMVLLRLKAE